MDQFETFVNREDSESIQTLLRDENHSLQTQLHASHEECQRLQKLVECLETELAQRQVHAVYNNCAEHNHQQQTSSTNEQSSVQKFNGSSFALPLHKLNAVVPERKGDSAAATAEQSSSSRVKEIVSQT